MNDQASTVDRNFQRRRVIKGGIIAYNMRRITLPCVVRDLSAAGARLQVDAPDGVPNTFDLLIELDGFECECETMWREGKQIGVRFLAEPTITAPKRVQVVNSSDQAPAPAIRLAERKREFQPSPDQRQAPVEQVAANDSFRPMQDPDEPRPQVTQPTTAAPVANAAATTGPILIIENDPRGRFMFEEAFKVSSESPALEFVADGRELGQYLAGDGEFGGKPRPGLVLVDIDAPEIDGAAILHLIRNTPGLNSIPVMAMTNSSDAHQAEDPNGFGIGSYVRKPDNIMDMVEMTKTVIRFLKNFSQ